jgi:hypothetical protein
MFNLGEELEIEEFEPPDPLFKDGKSGQWFWFDESGVYVHGGFDTKELALTALDNYINDCL